MAFFGMGEDTGTETLAKKKLASLDSQEKQDAIVPPDIREAVKTAKIKDPEMEMAQSLIAKGISPLTDPTKFLQAFGATAEQAGIARTWGPLDRIREAVSPDYQNLKARQQGLLQIGSVIHGEMAKQFINRMNAPQTLQEAQQVLPGVVQPVESQRGASLDQIVGQGMQGPTQAVDPNSQLTPFQSQLAGTVLSSLGEGRMMRTDEGIVPTGFATVQGRRVSPQEFQFAQEAAITPPGQPLAIPQGSLPQPLVNKILEERGQAGRQLMRGPDLNNRLESLAAVESVKRFGAPMNFTQIAQRDPVVAAQLRQQAEIDEAKDIIAFQNLEGMKRSIAQAAPVAARQESAKKEVDRDQPVQEPQLWRHPVTGLAAKADMTTREAQKANYVKVRPDQVETINQLEVIDNGLNEIKEIAKRILRPKKASPMGEAMRAMSQSMYLGWLRAIGNPDMLKLDSITSRLTAPLVKSQGDAANIAVAEREMFAKALLNNRASAEAVIENLDNVMNASRSARRMMGFKVPVSKTDKPLDTSADAARARIRELAAQGLGAADIKKTLVQEGFK